jgi:hypothetical protein
MVNTPLVPAWCIHKVDRESAVAVSRRGVPNVSVGAVVGVAAGCAMARYSTVGRLGFPDQDRPEIDGAAGEILVRAGLSGHGGGAA